jgi:DNA-binding SARP family transcriptional activator/predicted ATPase
MTQLKLYLFGAKEILLDDMPVHITRRKALAMLIYLAVTEKPHERDTLGAMFWPESADSRNQVRVALSGLRTVLGAEWFTEHSNALQIANTAHIWVDVLAFKTLHTLSLRDPEQCVKHLEQAIDLARGGFLAGFTLRNCPAFDSWVQSEEFYLERETNKALRNVIDCHRQSRDFERAIYYAEQYVARDSLNEDSYRVLMELYLQHERIHHVVRVFELCAETLQHELGIAPSTELQTLLQQAKTPQQSKQRIEPTSGHTPIPYLHHAFIGRDAELNTVLDLLTNDTCRLISLVGIGGIGKTHLATRISELAPTHTALDVCFVSLEGLQNAEQAALALASQLQLWLEPNIAVVDQIVSHLKPKHLLVIFDNIEQFSAAITPLLAQIIQHTPAVKLLITSRVMLHMHQEHVVRLVGLTYPHDHANHEAGELQHYDSVRVFMHWARKHNPSFQLTESNIHAVAELCQLLEGIPLAIRLAAVWCELLSVEDLLSEIHQNVNMLQSQLVDIPEKHRSMRALFDSIWGQLNAQEQQAFTRLVIFRGGFTRQAAQQVADITPLLLKSLLDKSLLAVDSDLGRRYRIHAILRLFAEEEESQLSDRQALDVRYVDYYARFVSVRESDLTGGNQHRAIHEIDAEFANIQAAWQLAVEAGKVDILSTMLAGLYLYLRFRGYWDEGRALFNRAQIGLTHFADDKTQHFINKLSARYYDLQQNTLPALLKLKSAAEAYGDPTETAYLTSEIAWHALFWGRYQLSLRYFYDALERYQRLEDEFQVAAVLRGIALCETARGNFDEAAQYNHESITIQQQVGDSFGLALNFFLRGEILLLNAEIHLALENLLTACDYQKAYISEHVVLRHAHLLPWCYVLSGDISQGTELASRLVAVTEALGIYGGEYMMALLILALVAALDGNTDESELLLQRSRQILADPDLQTGRGKFEFNLRLLSKAMIALTHCLNGRLEAGHILINELKALQAILTRPIVMNLLHTAEVISLYVESHGTLQDELIAHLVAQPWLIDYIKRH